MTSRLMTRRGLFRAGFALLILGLVAPQAWAWYQLRAARTALERYHPEQARQALTTCERIWNSRVSIHLLASRAARQAGDIEAASRHLRDAQQLSGGATDETAFEWALLQAASGNVLEVEDYLQKCIGRSAETDPLIWEALIEGYLRVYRTPDAMACLNHWLGRDKDNVRALELRGMTYVTGRGVTYGAADYRTVLSMDPSRKNTRWRLIGCLLDLGAFDEAAEHLEWIARESPDDPEVAARLARCYYMLGRSGEGRQLIDSALQKHPENGICLRTLGQFRLAEGNLPGAEEALRRAIAVLPQDYQTNWLLFQAFQQQGKRDEARAQLVNVERVKERNEHLSELTSRKLAEQPLDPSLRYELGTFLMRGGRVEVAVQWFQSALELDPNHRPSHTALAEYYDRIGDHAKAAEHRRKATAQDPIP